MKTDTLSNSIENARVKAAEEDFGRRSKQYQEFEETCDKIGGCSYHITTLLKMAERGEWDRMTISETEILCKYLFSIHKK